MRFFYFIFFVFISLGATASNAIDSIGVENQNGNQLILHKVQAKETYYSIARLYKVSPRSIIEQNNNIPLHIGTLVKVPTERPFNKARLSSQANNANSNFIEYKVGRREFLYTIAKRFNTTVEAIKALNNLSSDKLSVGQTLKIPQGQNAATPAVVEVRPQVVSPSPLPEEADEKTEEKPRIPTSRLGLSERNERGVAVWITDENLDGSKMLALHRTAPIGTVVKITNPMTDRATFVKVVGKFTENETTKDVIIVITKATAELLGALDKRFQVSIDYGMPNE
ncbi:LysM peptidoglycan-binding domain-containing protein [Paradesertivirga mongoliensis]|uniref:LysM peptidoglycan-binding domain-containing protein n=1 Tax=Paradesertivirga mongoliensis TaxID=2100740 RepID=A0ABW4ZQ48_9SPHI|nr:LysM peptidoglycan-binding domain-containing protein [Pedobacter mongoliensis]